MGNNFGSGGITENSQIGYHLGYSVLYVEKTYMSLLSFFRT